MPPNPTATLKRLNVTMGLRMDNMNKNETKTNFATHYNINNLIEKLMTNILVTEANQPTQSMTVYEIVNLVGYTGQHKQAMKMCETLTKGEDFKGDEESLSLKTVTYGNNGQTLQSYSLNKRQSFALASRLNVSFLMLTKNTKNVK